MNALAWAIAGLWACLAIRLIWLSDRFPFMPLLVLTFILAIFLIGVA